MTYRQQSQKGGIQLAALIGWGSLLCGLLFRLLGAVGDLWLDEVWSIVQVSLLDSPLKILSALKLDNNHLLNSLYIYLIGKSEPDLIYRIPALACSIGTLLISFFWWLKQKTPFSLILLILITFSFPLVLYGTEARGYSSMIFFGLLSYCFLEKYFESEKSIDLLLSGIFSTLAFLSHFTAIHFVSALLCSLFYRSFRKDGFHSAVFNIVFTGCIPGVVVGLLWYYFIREMLAGTGPIVGYGEVFFSTLAMFFAGYELSPNNPQLSTFLFVWGIAGFLVLLAQLCELWKERNDRWFFIVLAALVFPTCFLLVFRPRVLFIRYFLVGIIVFLPLFSLWLSRKWSDGYAGKILVTVFLGVFLYGNISQNIYLLKYGRGTYRQALQYIVEVSAKGERTIASDHDFRNLTLIEYYFRELPEAETLRYYVVGNDKEHPFEWYIMHSQDRWLTPPRIHKTHGRIYGLEKEFSSAPLSGWRWFLYRLKNQQKT